MPATSAKPKRARNHNGRTSAESIPHRRKRSFFQRFARKAARGTGHPASFGIAIFVILLWGVTGPLFGFSDTWQLVINTGTTIVTFLMVFLIQNTQNRDSEAMQLKLDEIIRALPETHNALMDIEELSDDELDRLKKRFEHLAKKACADLRSGKNDFGIEDLE